MDKEFELDPAIAEDLYDHQLVAVHWLSGLLENNKGGILADDMGLGKTRTCAAFIAGSFRSRLIKRVMIVVPTSLVELWCKELSDCGLRSRIYTYLGVDSARNRSDDLSLVLKYGGILLVSYGMVQRHAEAMSTVPRGHTLKPGQKLWDVVILDEAHTVKNHATQTYKGIAQVPCRTMILITGTPLQNNLDELWSLYNLCTPGLFGGREQFKRHFSARITTGRDKKATQAQQNAANAVAKELRDLCGPYFLRREKREVNFSKPNGDNANGNGNEASTSVSEISSDMQAMKLGKKNDMIIWMSLQETQRKIYKEFLSSDAVKFALNKTKSPLAAITVLKKICDHPALISERATNVVTHNAKFFSGEYDDAEDSSEEDGIEDWNSGEALRVSGQSSGTSSRNLNATEQEITDDLIKSIKDKGWRASCKTVFVFNLVNDLTANGHRTLIFSQTRKMLDIVQAGLTEKGIQFLRIDGTIKQDERQAIVDKFQSNEKYSVCLLTSKVGGLGLTLTGADRVIILDPAWNPATDNQSVDRAFRIGQKKDVVVYRLITCGTVEEKIYKRQVFKHGVAMTSIKQGNQLRYFTNMELTELFVLKEGDLDQSRTCQQLNAMHMARTATQELQGHIQHLENLPECKGVSDHDLLYSVREAHSEATLAEAGITAWNSDHSQNQVDDIAKSMGRLSMDPAQETARRKQQLKTELKKLDVRLQQAVKMLKNTELLGNLPDKGANIQKLIKQLGEDKQRLEGELRDINRVEEFDLATDMPLPDDHSSGSQGLLVDPLYTMGQPGDAECSAQEVVDLSNLSNLSNSLQSSWEDGRMTGVFPESVDLVDHERRNCSEGQVIDLTGATVRDSRNTPNAPQQNVDPTATRPFQFGGSSEVNTGQRDGAHSPGGFAFSQPPPTNSRNAEVIDLVSPERANAVKQESAFSMGAVANEAGCPNNAQPRQFPSFLPNSSTNFNFPSHLSFQSTHSGHNSMRRMTDCPINPPFSQISNVEPGRASMPPGMDVEMEDVEPVVPVPSAPDNDLDVSALNERKSKVKLKIRALQQKRESASGEEERQISHKLKKYYSEYLEIKKQLEGS